MTKKEKILVSKLLEMSSDEFSNHGCNDLDEDWFTDWSPSEIHELNKSIIDDDDFLDFDDTTVIAFGDSMLMDYLADRILEDD